MIGPVSLSVRYRPLRIGWCVEGDNLEHFSKSVALSHVFWGGRFSPIIPCADRPLAEALIKAFSVDALYNISGTDAVNNFIKEFPHLVWPDYHPELFVTRATRKLPRLLDIGHPARHLFESHVDRREKPAIDAVFYQWEPADPLRYALQATCGTYPQEAETGRDYARVFQKAFTTQPTVIGLADPIPNDLFRKVTPNYLTTAELEATPLRSSHWTRPGFYYGDALAFADLVNFWNLRACDIDLFFVDPKYPERLRPLIESFATILRQRPQNDPSPNNISVWAKNLDPSRDLRIFGPGLSLCTFSDGSLNGLNLNPPVMTFPAKPVLGAAAENSLGTSVTFLLPQKPFYSDFELHTQMVVVSVSAPNIGNAMLTPPFIPALNEYYGRNLYFMHDKARAERGSLGIIDEITREQLTLTALPFTDVLSKVFETYGMSAKPSPAGLVSTRLIEQLGGLQGCRVFKIAGVRSLIKKYMPGESFERTEAITMIGNNDPATNLPRFDPYKPLYIEQRDKKDLKPEDAFLYLLKRGVFRAGLKLACPTCQLDFWVTLDDAKSTTPCPYCGFQFNVLPQLRDRNWAYRRSGLFGREDNQRGGIPVAVTLQQLDTMLQGRLQAYAPGLELKPNTAPIEDCEIDLVILASSLGPSEKPLELVIAECKDSGGEITTDDVRKLTKVAHALEDSQCDVFILFSKCGRFTPDEVERCKEARRKLFEHEGKMHYAYNVIMLSDRELEPYHPYQHLDKEFEIQPYVHTFEDLAINTANIYLEPRLKPAAQGQ